MGLVVELETAAPVHGLQDTGSGGNRVLYESSGASRLTIRAEQKPGHFSWNKEQDLVLSRRGAGPFVDVFTDSLGSSLDLQERNFWRGL